MLKRDLRDILAGSFVSMVGLFFAIAGTNYTFGTAARMGPGYMPVVLAMGFMHPWLADFGASLISPRRED